MQKTIKKAFFCVISLLFCDVFAQQVAPIVAPVAPVVPLSVNPISSTNQSGMSQSTQTTQSSSTTTRNGQTQTTTTQTQNGMELSAANLSSLANTLMGGGGTNTEALSSLLNNSGLGGAQNNLGSNPATAQILQQILTRLDQIQQTVNAQNPQHDVQNQSPFSTNQEKTVAVQSQTGGKILRFMVNNYNILSTCETIFFSDQSDDGSFLLTGDRVYYADGLTRSETFYLLFNKISVNEYDIACTVSQDSENKSSFLYKLSQKEKIHAKQTGNFVTVHLNEPQWKMDLLIDLEDL